MPQLGYHSGVRRTRSHDSCGALLTAVTTLLLLSSLAWAQELPLAAADALRQGDQLVTEALATYTQHFPDHRLWSEAIDAGQVAAAVAPDHPAPHRFLAETYGRVSWHARSWLAWQRYLELGGELDADASRQLLETAFWLGIQAFDAGRPDAARTYLETVVRLEPDNLGARDRLARLALERGAPEEAWVHLDRLDEIRVPDLPALRERSDLQARHGARAADDYLAGRAAQASGDHRTAFDRYAAATAAHDGFVEAWRGLGHAALTLERAGDAVSAWERALQLAPDDEASATDLVRARDLLAFGRGALRAFDQGVAAYAAGDRALALAAFREAVALSPAYLDAWAWLGRLAAEAGDLVTASAHLQRAVALDPERADLAQALAEIATTRAAAGAPPTAPAVVVPPAREDGPPPGPPAMAAASSPLAGAVDPPPSAPSGSARTTLIDKTLEHRSVSDGGTGAFTFLDAPHPRVHLEDARSASLVVRLEVRTKAASGPIDYQLCLLPQDIASAPACTAPAQLRVSEAGTYTLEQSFESLSGGAPSGRFDVVGLLLVLRHPDGSPIDEPNASPRPANEAVAASPYPMDVHVTGILVTHGQPSRDAP